MSVGLYCFGLQRDNFRSLLFHWIPTRCLPGNKRLYLWENICFVTFVLKECNVIPPGFILAHDRLTYYFIRTQLLCIFPVSTTTIIFKTTLRDILRNIQLKQHKQTQPKRHMLQNYRILNVTALIIHACLIMRREITQSNLTRLPASQ